MSDIPEPRLPLVLVGLLAHLLAHVVVGRGLDDVGGRLLAYRRYDGVHVLVAVLPFLEVEGVVVEHLLECLVEGLHHLLLLLVVSLYEFLLGRCHSAVSLGFWFQLCVIA